MLSLPPPSSLSISLAAAAADGAAKGEGAFYATTCIKPFSHTRLAIASWLDVMLFSARLRFTHTSREVDMDVIDLS